MVAVKWGICPTPCPGWGWLSPNGSVGIWSPLCDRHLPLLPHGGQRGALHEEDFLQEAAALLHSSGDWNPLLQRPLPAHPRGMASQGFLTQEHASLWGGPVGTTGGPSTSMQGRGGEVLFLLENEAEIESRVRRGCIA